MTTTQRLATTLTTTPAQGAAKAPLSAPVPLSPELLRLVSGGASLPKGGW